MNSLSNLEDKVYEAFIAAMTSYDVSPNQSRYALINDANVMQRRFIGEISTQLRRTGIRDNHSFLNTRAWHAIPDTNHIFSVYVFPYPYYVDSSMNIAHNINMMLAPHTGWTPDRYRKIHLDTLEHRGFEFKPSNTEIVSHVEQMELLTDRMLEIGQGLNV